MNPAWTESLWKIVYPPRCLLCSSLLPPGFLEPLCLTCKPAFSRAGVLCSRCEQLVETPEKCTCLPLSPLQGLYALSWYQGDWRTMLHRLKYEGCRHLARPLGAWLGMLLTRETPWFLQAVVPLPLHRSRETQRGYNQSALIARYTARAMGLPQLHLLKKIKPTPAQAGLSKLERRANVSGVFALAGRNNKPGPVLLIDDIYSTGATLKEAAWLLNDRGYTVFAAVAAYNPRLL